jgi:GH25 family lysozyme M1 (1,4-beta-N-acetylmuramidase)
MLDLNLDTDFFWLDIEIGNWYSDNVTKNREFFQELVNADFGKNRIGIYTSKHNWSTLMGSDYTEGSQFPLWYAHYDQLSNFDDFQPFGNWFEPQQKQFSGDQIICGVDVDFNYMEQSKIY